MALTDVLEEDHDALHMVNDPVPLSDSYLRDLRRLICHGKFDMDSGDQTPHFRLQYGAPDGHELQ